MYSYSYNQYYQQYQNYYAQWGYDQNTGSYSYSYPQYGYTQSTMQVTMVWQIWSSWVMSSSITGLVRMGAWASEEMRKDEVTSLSKIRPPCLGPGIYAASYPLFGLLADIRRSWG